MSDRDVGRDIRGCWFGVSGKAVLTKLEDPISAVAGPSR